MLCRDGPDASFTVCTKDYICEKRELGAALFEYKPNTHSEEYFDNWFIDLDLMCKTTGEINQVASMFFIGYGIGVLLFFLPDKIGRKGTMKFILPAHIMASFVSVFGQSLYLKSVGFLLQGVLHLRITISYCHCLELMMDKDKPIASTAINSLDSGSIMIMSLIFYYYNKHVS